MTRRVSDSMPRFASWKVAVLLLLPVAGRDWTQKDGFLGVDGLSRWHAHGDTEVAGVEHGDTAKKPPSPEEVKQVVENVTKAFPRQIFPYARGIQTQNGKASRLMVSRDVALSDPVLKA